MRGVQADNNWVPTGHNDRNSRKKRHFNPDLEHITKDTISYLSKTPAVQQSEDSITSVMKELASFQLEKIEKLQILNSAPHSLVNLYAIVEECDQRFTEEECERILFIMSNYFPADDGAGEAGEGEGEVDQPEEMDVE